MFVDSRLGGSFSNRDSVRTPIQFQRESPGIKITDFQMPDKTSGAFKYLPDILKIHRTTCTCVLVHEFKRPQLLYLLNCIMATVDKHKYSFREINTYCVNKPSIIFFRFFFISSTAKS